MSLKISIQIPSLFLILLFAAPCIAQVLPEAYNGKTIPNFGIYHGRIKPHSVVKCDNNNIFWGESETLSILGMTLKAAPPPETLNGNKIYVIDDTEITKKPRLLNPRLPFYLFIFKQLQSEFNKLDDGTYSLPMQYLIINEYGKVVFFDFFYFRRVGASAVVFNSDLDPDSLRNSFKITTKPNINAGDTTSLVGREKAEPIYKKLYKVLNSLKFSPALLQDGKPVSCNVLDLDEYSFYGFIEVKNHTSSYRRLPVPKTKRIIIPYKSPTENSYLPILN